MCLTFRQMFLALIDHLADGPDLIRTHMTATTDVGNVRVEIRWNVRNDQLAQSFEFSRTSTRSENASSEDERQRDFLSLSQTAPAFG